MAIAVSIVAQDATGLKRVIADLTFSGTYATGGDVSTNGLLKDLGLSKCVFAKIESGAPVAQTALGTIAKYEYTTDKITLWEGGAAADSPMKEVTNAQSIANLVLRGEFVGYSR